MKAALGRFFDGLILAMAWLGAVCIAFILLVVSAGAISRFFFHHSLTWTTELTEYALLYTTFLLAPYVLKQDRHVRVDIILNIVRKRNPRTLAAMEIVGNALGFVIFGVIGYYGVLVTVDNFVRKVQNPTILQFPKGVLLLVIPLGCICMVVQFGRRLAYWTKAWRTGKGVEHVLAEESPDELVDETA